MNRPAQCCAVMPAAGLSQRMGRPKLLLPWAGRTVLEQSIANFRDAAIDHVLVVLRHGGPDELAAAATRAGAYVVWAEGPEDMKASLLVGLGRACELLQPGPSDAWLVSPADLPALDPRVIRQVVAAYDPRRPRCVVPRYGARRGHPVLLPWSLAEAVRRLPPEAGLDTVVKSADTTDVLLVDTVPPRDLDTPDDYRRAQETLLQE
ncbi:MAG: nucleotidyltransferase family protein [Pirellulales bacterium]|nr:nucleotidyltransferase family protein [Pirellulales bacterium]